ncbi:MAG: glycosyltransferase family 4 protein [Candidatus Omnitrophica bacterium]|nr:glycosyltransferase family 4 protein [Candidatus Omnitrophota bacterium]
MKILQLTTHLEPGGIPVYVAGLAQALKKAGHEPVVVSSGGWLEKRLEAAGVRHDTVPCRTSSELNPMLWIRALPRLLKIIRTERPDILHAHTRVMQVMAWVCSKITGIPFVTTCHGLYQFRFGRRFFRCWGRSVMAISGATMHRLVEQYRLAPPHHVTLVINGVDVDRLSEPVSAEEARRFRETNGLRSARVVGSIGRLSPVKGLDDLLRSVPVLAKEFPDLQVLLVGDGPAREDLVRLAYELGIADRVVISHAVEDIRVPMAMMRVFAAPALEEGFGLSIVEAMASGVPVVTTRSGGPGEIIEDGKCGFVVEPRDVDGIARAVRILLSDERLRAGFVEEARARAREHYDLKRMVREVEQVYARVVS